MIFDKDENFYAEVLVIAYSKAKTAYSSPGHLVKPRTSIPPTKKAETMLSN